MKRNLRKFLSLLMVFALLCGMVPAAFAVSASDYEWDYSTVDTSSMAYLACLFGNGHSPRGYGYTTTCRVCGATGYIDGYYDDGDYTGHDHRYTYYNSQYHLEECYSHPNCYYYEEQLEPHSGSSYCRYCDYGYGGSYGDLTWEYSSVCDEDYWGDHDPIFWKTEDGWDLYYCRNCYEEAWARSDSYNSTGLILTPADNLTAGDTYELNALNAQVSVSAKVLDTDGKDITDQYTFTFTWSGDCGTGTDAASGTSSSALLDTEKYTCSVQCTVKATKGDDVLTDYVTWYATAGAEIEVEATIYNSNTGYYLNEVDDEGYTSIEDQIYAAVSALGDRSNDYILDYIEFDDVSETGGYLYDSTGYVGTTTKYYYDYYYSSSSIDLISEVAFYPTAGYVGKVEFPFTAYYYDDNSSGYDLIPATGTITFDVQQGAAGLGIVYTALNGETVELDEEDFVDFWEEIYPYGTLDSVSFNVSSSKGTIYDAYDKRVTGTCYYDPTGNQTGLYDLTFVPKNSTVTGAVEITFTAKGTKTYSSSVNNGTATGTVTILYTANEVTPIEYESTSDGIALDPDDFLAKYKEVMNAKTATANSLSIQFLDVPTYGSLYLNYNNSYFYNNGVELTDANVLNYSFSGNKNAQRSIADLTYIPGNYSAAGESLRFACYYGSALKFIGTVNFGTTDPIAIEYVTAGTTPVTFSSYDFYSASLSTGSLYFGTPSYGTLYRNYVNGTGTRVTAYDAFSTSAISYGSTYSLNTLTYVPAAGYVGVVEIPVYSTYSLLGAKTLGVVKIYVGRSFTDIAGTSHAWALPYINKLSAQGIVNGTDTGMTKYSPAKTVTYGEALKLIMMAAGYPEQAKTNTHWASGYLTKAYYDGLVSSSVIDLNAEVTRDTIASITAKALGLSYATSINYGVVAPTDSTNGYVYALYNAGIVGGSYNAAGQNVYNGSNALTRAEISKIICTVSEYYEANN